MTNIDIASSDIEKPFIPVGKPDRGTMEEITISSSSETSGIEVTPLISVTNPDGAMINAISTSEDVQKDDDGKPILLEELPGERVDEIIVNESDLAMTHAFERQMVPVSFEQMLSDFLHFFGFSIQPLDSDWPLMVEEIRWFETDEDPAGSPIILPEDIVIVDEDVAVMSDRKQELTDNIKIDFQVWQMERNTIAAQLFFTNVRRNIAHMTRRVHGGDATMLYSSEHYLDGEMANVHDFVNATLDWGIPMVIHAPSHHASLVLKMPEYDLEKKEWKVLVYDPIAGGEQYKWLPNLVKYHANVVDDEITFLDEPTDSPDDPIHNAAAYGLLYHADGAAKQLWDSGSYDLSVGTDASLALDEHSGALQEKLRAVQFDAENCVLASGFMAVVRACLKYPDSIMLEQRARIYQDTGVIFNLRDEVLRKRQPPTSDELMAELEV